MNEHFQWSAFDPNKWNHYYHAGQQVRFYRQAPCHLTGSGFYIPEPKWIDRILNLWNKRKGGAV